MLLLVVLGVACGAGAGYAVGRLLKSQSVKLVLDRGDLLWVPVAWFVAIAVHEAGHLAFGALAGMRPLLFLAGPLRVAREGGGFRVGFNGNLATWGGLAAALPPNADGLRERLARMVLGGPLASAALTLACAAVLLASGLHPHVAVITLGVLSLFITVATLLPLESGGFQSDGAQLLALRRGGPEVERRALLVALVSASGTGVRPRDLERTLLDRALALPGAGVGRAAALFLAALAACDRGDDAAPLAAELGSCFHAYPNGFRQGIAQWLAWYLASEHRDLARARAWLALGRGGVRDGALPELAEAAVAERAGDFAAARAAAERGLARGPGMDPGGAVFVREQLARIRERVSAATPVTAG